MSYYCKGKDCPKSQICYRQVRHWLSKEEQEKVEEGMATRLWFVNEQACINNNYSEGVFPKE